MEYYIGINKSSNKLIFALMDLGCILMDYYNPITIELNFKYKFNDGEWFVITCHDDSKITNIKILLERQKIIDHNLKFEIIHY